MSRDMRIIVEKGYNEGDYQRHFRTTENLNKRENRFFKKLLGLIPGSCKILDFGSGTGIPYDKFLDKMGHDITGIDMSSKHVGMARANVPGAKYIKGDFTKIDFPLSSFDAVIALYSIFHVPREEHASLFTKIHGILKENGIIMVTTGMYDDKLSINDFIGSTMAWSSYSAEKNKLLLIEAGFELLLVEEQLDKEEHHLWILARKICKS
ncbi:MAG: class I SAM-dependent methyltransferase [Candidatus Hodarchaeales archaeon]|jgi:SAM-dependent methyltransferase